MVGQEQGPPGAVLSYAEIVQGTIFCLRHFWNDEKLEHSKMSRLRVVTGRLASRDMLAKTGETATATPAAAVPDAIRSVLRDSLALLAQGTGRFAFRSGADQAKLICLVYIDRAGSHERVMERLDLPHTTYYRRLRTALQNIASIVASLEREQESF